MSKELAPLPKKEVAEAMEMIEQARSSYSFMQRSWFQFAKTIYMIKSSEVYIKAGVAETFTQYIEKEFPTISPSTVTKFISIIDKWGESIESRFKKDETYVLPAYDSCYDLVAKEDRIPKEEFSKMKKAVLDNKMGLVVLREKLKEYVTKHRAKVREEVEEDYGKLEDELSKDIEKEVGEEEEYDDDFMPEDVLSEPDEEAEIDDADADAEVSAATIHTRVQYLIESLPELRTQLEGATLTKQLIKLADDLSTLQEMVDEFLTKVEEKSNEQAVSKTKKGT